MINGSNVFDQNPNEEIILTNKSKYPNLYEYQSIPDNNKYFIFPIQMTNPYSFPESESNAQIHSNLFEEIGLFNIYKEINYDLELQQEFSTSMYTFEASIDQKEFYNDLIYLLQGIPNSTFILTNKFPFSFKLNENNNTNNLRFMGTLPNMTSNILKKFIDFGSKMHLMQFLVKKYLFDVNYRNSANTSPFFENFFRGINEIFIKINEKLIFYKKLITQENFTMMTLYNKVISLSQILNVIYIIFGLNDMKYKTKFEGNTIEEFFIYYNANNNFKKINLFLDMLLTVYFTFYKKDKIFYIIKHILLSSLHSYLYYIINLLFTGDSTDDAGEHFILVSNNINDRNASDNISLDTKKLPQFLYEYKRLLLNNTILTKYIKKFDENYYNMLTYNLKDFIEYINNINIRKFSIDTLNNFKAFKEEIYKRKIILMEEINKEVIYLQELKENEINLKNIEKIREIKNYFSEYEKNMLNKKKKIKEKKEKYYNDLKEQILGKKRRIEEEIKKIKNEEIKQKEKEKKEKDNERKFLQLMKIKYQQIQQKTKDIEIYGSLINKWIYQRNELNERRKLLYDKLYNDNSNKNIDEFYPLDENKKTEDVDTNIKKNYHKTFQEKLELINKEMDKEIIENENKNDRALYNNSDNIKKIFNQIDENKEEIKNNELKDDIKTNEDNIKIDENQIINEDNNKNNDKQDNKDINMEKANKYKNDVLNTSIKENQIEENTNEIKEIAPKENIVITNNNNNDNNKTEKIILPKDDNNANKNKYLQNINLFPEKSIQEDENILYQLSTLIKSESEEKDLNENYNIITDDIFLDKKNKNKQIPIQLIIKEFFYDIITKQNMITNQTFVLMLKNKFGLMHHFDFFNSIIFCKKGNLILQYIEIIFDFKTLTLYRSDPDFLTNELRALVKSDYENNIKSLYLNSLLESLKFKRISDLNLNYAINDFELNFRLEYSAAPPIDVIFNSSNSDVYDKIFKKLLKYNIYNQIGVRIYQILKNMRNIGIKKSEINNNFNEVDINDNSSENNYNSNDNFNEKLIKIFNDSFRIFKGILSYIYHQIIEKTWIEMEQKIESSFEVFQIIKYHQETLKYIYSFFNSGSLILNFENLCNDLSQLYLQIIVSDYYDKQNDKNEFLGEIMNKLKIDNKAIIDFKDSIGDLNPFSSLKSYL